MKYILSASAAVLMFGNVLADLVAAPVTAAAPEPETKLTADEHTVIEEPAECCEAACGNLFNSAYLGLGVVYNHTKNRLTENDGDSFNGKSNRVLGTVVLGAGKVFNGHFYFGGDAMFDFGKNKRKKQEYDDDSTLQFVNKGFDWNAGLRLGYAADNGLLTYVKGGASYAKLQARILTTATGALGDSYSCNKVAPMVALGLEKVMNNGFSVRGEVEYNFKAKKKYTDLKVSRKNTFAVRLIVAKHINY